VPRFVKTERVEIDAVVEHRSLVSRRSGGDGRIMTLFEDRPLELRLSHLREDADGLQVFVRVVRGEVAGWLQEIATESVDQSLGLLLVGSSEGCRRQAQQGLSLLDRGPAEPSEDCCI